MNRLLKLMIVLILSVSFLVACGENNTEPNQDDAADTYKVGITQYVEHPSLNQATQGFKDALAKADVKVTYAFNSAQGDPNNVNPIAQKFVADRVDLIFANATPSAQAALDEAEEANIPIVFTSVTDAVEAKLIEDMAQPSDHITGVVDLHPDSIQATIDFIDTYFADARIGLIYNAGEQNSVVQINAVKAAVTGTGLSLVERTVANSSEVNQAATTLVGEADVFFIVTDNTVVSAIDSVVSVANDYKIPLLVGNPDALADGGFATYGIDYYDIGYRTGEMAAAILSGEKKVIDIPVEYPTGMKLFINKQAATDQGVEWEDAWDEQAELVEGK